MLPWWQELALFVLLFSVKEFLMMKALWGSGSVLMRQHERRQNFRKSLLSKLLGACCSKTWRLSKTRAFWFYKAMPLHVCVQQMEHLAKPFPVCWGPLHMFRPPKLRHLSGGSGNASLMSFLGTLGQRECGQYINQVLLSCNCFAYATKYTLLVRKRGSWPHLCWREQRGRYWSCRQPPTCLLFTETSSSSLMRTWRLFRMLFLLRPRIFAETHFRFGCHQNCDHGFEPLWPQLQANCWMETGVRQNSSTYVGGAARTGSRPYYAWRLSFLNCYNHSVPRPYAEGIGVSGLRPFPALASLRTSTSSYPPCFTCRLARRSRTVWAGLFWLESKEAHFGSVNNSFRTWLKPAKVCLSPSALKTWSRKICETALADLLLHANKRRKSSTPLSCTRLTLTKPNVPQKWRTAG